MQQTEVLTVMAGIDRRIWQNDHLKDTFGVVGSHLNSVAEIWLEDFWKKHPTYYHPQINK